MTIARPALALNTHGAVSVRPIPGTDPRKPRKYAARCRYRHGDGTTRLVERVGADNPVRNLAARSAAGGTGSF